jgi:hypothetical protein
VTNFTSNQIDKASPNKESKSILAPLLIPYNNGVVSSKNKNPENTIEQPSLDRVKFKTRRRSNKSPLKSVNKLEKLRKQSLYQDSVGFQGRDTLESWDTLNTQQH